MEIHRGALLSHAQTGRLTLQVPQCVLNLTGEELLSEQVPDAWIYHAKKQDGPPAVGRQRAYAYWFISREGYAHVGPAMEQAFAEARAPEDASQHPALRQMFRDYAMGVFARREAALRKEIQKQETKLRELASHV